MRNYLVLITLIGGMFLFSCSGGDSVNVEDAENSKDISLFDTTSDLSHSDISDVKDVKDIVSDTGEDVGDAGYCSKVCPNNMHCENDNCVCNDGFGDCNGDMTDGCEVDLKNDIQHCGRCDMDCSGWMLHALFKCVDGDCEVDQCMDGFENCDGRSNNGCEIDLRRDPRNCGRCNRDCGPNSVCEKGVCGCETGFADCNNTISDGCEQNISSDDNNCGGCGRTCGNKGHCSNGNCICEYGSANCNNNWGDGCETNTKDDIYHCGDCNTDCTKLPNVTGSFCSNGRCIISSCKARYADCDGDYRNGCEASLDTDGKNCGSCSNSCGKNAKCNAGSCECLAGYMNCNNSFSDGCETDIMTDSLNCGNCNNRCNANAVCDNGACTCLNGYGNCNNSWSDGCESDFSKDNRNCGKCGMDCGYLRYCSGGVCLNCDLHYGNCNYDSSDLCEVNLYTDSNNCGSCGNNCGRNSYCSQGNCRCAQNYWDCNNDRSDGCEVDIANDNNNCGGCGRKCGFKAYCESGNCKCEQGYSNCDGSWDNGCEVYLLSDSNNCGSCKNSCNDNARCENGGCVCNTGYGNCNNSWGDGCESNLSTDKNNCSGCGIRCYRPAKYYAECINSKCAGALVFAKSFGGSVDDVVSSIAVDSSNNIFIAGTFTSESISFDSYTLSLESDDVASFLVKLNSSGSVEWAKRVPGEIRKIGVFPSGEITVVGEYSKNIRFEGNNLTNKGGYDIYIARFEENEFVNDLFFKWVRVYGGSGDDRVTDLFLSENYDSFISGYTNSNNLKFGENDLIQPGAFIVRFDVYDNFLWSKSFTDSIYINAITGRKDVSQKEQIALTGYISKSYDFGCGIIPGTKGGTDIFLTVIDYNGNCYASKTFGGLYDDRGISIVYNGEYFIVAGDYKDDTIDFGDGTSITSKGSNDIFIFGYDPDYYTIKWVKSYGGNQLDTPTSIALTQSGDIIVTGYFSTNTINFGGGSLANSGDGDAFILKIDKSGNYLFSRVIGGGYSDSGIVVKVDSANNYIISGKFGSESINIDNITLNNSNGTGMNIFDTFLIKLAY